MYVLHDRQSENNCLLQNLENKTSKHRLQTLSCLTVFWRMCLYYTKCLLININILNNVWQVPQPLKVFLYDTLNLKRYKQCYLSKTGGTVFFIL